MSEFEKQFASLNAAQKKAVETIDGPLLVLAGPGTGKTTLLTARVAYILQRTDTLPENILCLTFTESAQKTMQSRLVGLIGQDGYKVHINTFHSFGTWAMRTYPEYFGLQLATKPADDVTRYQIFLKLFEQLNLHDPLASINDGDYLYLRDAITRISHLKQAGVTPDELEKICSEDEIWLQTFEKEIQKQLSGVTTINQKSVEFFVKLLSSLSSDIKSQLAKQATIELRLAIDEATETEKTNTKPITKWKNDWLVKKRDGSFATKYRKDLEKLKSLAKIYRLYQKTLKKRALIDYDDMLLQLLEVIAKNPDFLAELQERFLYIMVDEYQDTNGVQDKILEKIADNPIWQDKPNVMIVGDDDQAIYGFQGAYSSNVLDFLKRWPSTETITLTENYRSSPEIVNMTRSVIIQGDNRLETRYEYVDKELHTANKKGSKVRLLAAPSEEEARLALAADIKRRIDAGSTPSSIAVLSPKHRYLEELLPYLANIGIDVAYERRQNILNEQHIYELCLLAKLIVLVGKGEHKLANDLMPEVLSFAWLNIAPKSLWITSLAASRNHKSWLEIMEKSSDANLAEIASWIINQAKDAQTLPLEQMLDQLIGSDQSSKTFDSPYRRYYFDEATPKQRYLDLLISLIVLRDHLRNYQGVENLQLADFVNYVELRKQANLLVTNDHPLASRQDAINLMTAYKAKGMEFDSVYVLDGHHSVWEDPRERKNLIRLASHIANVPSGETTDERLRVFYVALTRAARQLSVITHLRDEKNNEVLPLGWLENSDTKAQLEHIDTPPAKTEQLALAAQFEWQDNVLPPGDLSWREVLQENIKDYHLSPTHLNAFLDVSSGGPRSFLINQLLRFPHALGPSASFGNVMHSLMHWLHTHKSLPAKDLALQYFAQEIAKYHLGDIETSKQRVKGERVIDHIYKHSLEIFGTGKRNLTERDFASEAVVIDGMRLKGKIDLMSIDEKTKDVTIADYKTGKPAYGWPVSSSKSYEALKLHKYRQQLLFYKLLIDNSRSYGGKLQANQAELVFLEPADDTDDLLVLNITYEKQELDRLQKLIKAVWQKIISLDLPDTNSYSPDISGVKQFEEDLLAGNV